MHALTVVKLGGSYAGSSHLTNWLGALVACAGHVVVVPGGGPFADTVRATQRRMGFDDGTAHRMALLAMEQYGLALVALARDIAPTGAKAPPANSAAAIRRALRDSSVPVWLPTRMALAADNVPCSWNVTSDSLAAWLARRLGARHVLLVKQTRPPAACLDANELAAQGLVDPLFAAFLAGSGAQGGLAGPDDYAQAAAAIRSGAAFGSRIDWTRTAPPSDANFRI